HFGGFPSVEMELLNLLGEFFENCRGEPVFANRETDFRERELAQEADASVFAGGEARHFSQALLHRPLANQLLGRLPRSVALGLDRAAIEATGGRGASFVPRNRCAPGIARRVRRNIRLLLPLLF